MHNMSEKLRLENTEENKAEAEKEFSDWGLDIALTNIIGLNKNNTDVIYFEQFENGTQAKKLYDYQITHLGEERSIKFSLKGDILISSNVEDAMSLLGYPFE